MGNGDVADIICFLPISPHPCHFCAHQPRATSIRARAWEMSPFILPLTSASTNSHWALVGKYTSSFPGVHSTVPRVPECNTAPAAHRGTGLAAFPPASLAQPSPAFPGVPSHSNFLHLEAGLSKCIGGSPGQDRNMETEGFTEGPKRGGKGCVGATEPGVETQREAPHGAGKWPVLTSRTDKARAERAGQNHAH